MNFTDYLRYLANKYYFGLKIKKNKINKILIYPYDKIVNYVKKTIKGYSSDGGNTNVSDTGKLVLHEMKEDNSNSICGSSQGESE